jgi:ABC-type proline/glycine betaine transport system ATPase subunit
MKKTIIVYSLSILLFACGSGNDTQQTQKLADEVVALHDSTMAKMDEMMTLKTQVADKIVQNTTLKAKGDSIVTHLTEADNAMSDWMAEFNYKYITEEHTQDEKLKYYQGELQKIKDVQTKMQSSIAEAKTFVK